MEITYNPTDLLRLQSELSSSRQIVLLGHVSPDGDAVGSTLALSRVLRKQGHSTNVLYPTPYPHSFGFLEGASEVVIAKHSPEEAIRLLEEAEMIFLMDFNEPKRVEQLEQPLISSKAFKVMIDHHLHPTGMVDVCFSYPQKAATCLLTYELIMALGWETYMDKQVAECIYTGMMTDTGGFNYNSEDPCLYTALSVLLEHGIEKDAITSLITRSFSVDKVRLNAYLLANNLTFFPKYHTAIITMGMKEKSMFEYQVGDTEGLVNEPLAAKDIHFSIFLHEQAKYTKISLRSKGKFPANEFASKFFNGGGHHNAAGAEVYASLNSVYDMVLEAVKLMHPEDND